LSDGSSSNAHLVSVARAIIGDKAFSITAAGWAVAGFGVNDVSILSDDWRRRWSLCDWSISAHGFVGPFALGFEDRPSQTGGADFGMLLALDAHVELVARSGVGSVASGLSLRARALAVVRRHIFSDRPGTTVDFGRPSAFVFALIVIPDQTIWTQFLVSRVVVAVDEFVAGCHA